MENSNKREREAGGEPDAKAAKTELLPEDVEAAFNQLTRPEKMRAVQNLVEALKDLDEPVIRAAWGTGLRIAESGSVITLKRPTREDISLRTLMLCLLGEIDFDMDWEEERGRERILPKVCPPETAVRIMKDAIDALLPTEEKDRGIDECTAFLIQFKDLDPSELPSSYYTWRLESLLIIVIGPEEPLNELTKEEEEEKKKWHASFRCNADRLQFRADYKITACALYDLLTDIILE